MWFVVSGLIGAVVALLGVYLWRRTSHSLADTARELARRNQRKARTEAEADNVAAEEKAKSDIEAVHEKIEEDIEKSVDSSNLVDFVNSSARRRKTD
jgi:F0F1-type ATP synthase membrane subunit b/b'